MYLFYTDESNLDPTKSDFFVYAGVAIPGQEAAALHADVEALRVRNGYQPLDQLKFTSNGRPNHVSAEQHLNAKRELMEAAARHNVRLITSMILHSIATSPEEARLNEINRVCFHFHAYLNGLNDSGIVLVDNFQGQGLANFLREKFGIGLRNMPYSKTLRLNRILGIHLSHIGFSHFCSLVDVALGSLRYAINERNNAAKVDIARALLAQLAPLFIRDGGRVPEISLFFSPKIIIVDKYRAQYTQLRDFMANNGIEAIQVPTNVRNY